MQNLQNVQNMGTDTRTARRNGDAGGTFAAVTVIALIAVAIGLLGYMIAMR
ncbi:hypothetical protein [Streptomyces sp. NBC_00259]|uniref:hypothetical protein n=1 Tax=Streptomyces sp. NBC_00259 TaxID=2903643 RepID=UPI002E2E5668|nr:hypothetical protein [Streptomyces sp. NBC_00259]